MRSSEREAECRNCQRTYSRDRLDRQRWCDRCRGVVVRRATIVGRLTGLAGSLLLMSWVFWTVGSAPRFFVGWLALVVATYFFLYTLTRRVAFEVIRGRGVPPPEEP
ncbi:hypothetical protein BH23GEM6_BH23GEM6_12220 [soil metagenome]